MGDRSLPPFSGRINPEPVDIDDALQDCGSKAEELAEEIFRQFDVPDHEIISFTAGIVKILENYAFRRLVGKLLDPKLADVKEFDKETARAKRDIEIRLNVVADARKNADPEFVANRIKYLLGEMDKIVAEVKIPARGNVKD